MSEVGDIERITQNRVVKLFREQLEYTYLGNWEDRVDNSNIEETYLCGYLKDKKKYSDNLISKALYELRKAANNLNDGLYSANKKVYGLMEFDLSSLPDPSETIITESYIQIKNKTIPKTTEDIRYNVEFVDVEDATYEAIQTRDRIEFIGYEVSRADIQNNKTHKFIFDQYSRLALEEIHSGDKKAKFIIKSTASDIKNHIVKWSGDNDHKNGVKLVIKYIKRRKEAVAEIENLETKVEKGKVKLTWENPKDKDFVGAYVVRNRFRKPKSPLDGTKIYAGPDNYTYDDFGNPLIDKYYAVFTYDNVPNYSNATIVKYKNKKDS